MKPESISIASAHHYQWGEDCDGWHLVRNEALSVIEERMPPKTAERRHVHNRAHQFFYVLTGELTLEVEGEEHLLRANEGLEVPPERAHQAFNRGPRDVRFLVTSQPPSHGDRIDA
jgi:mannose-6-phosphate isomerase-like protein (cupin superfamily)